MAKSYLLFTLFLTLTLSLSYHPKHYQADAEKEEYLNALLDVHNSMKQLSLKAKAEGQNVNRKAESIGDLPSLQKNILENGIQKERQIFLQMKNAAIIPNSLKTWQCRNLTQQQIDSKNILVAKLKEEHQQLVDALQSEGDCTRTDELNFQSQNIELTLKRLKNQLQNNCDPPKVLLPIMYVSNLNNIVQNNYILDGNTQESLEQENQQLKESYRIFECPQDKPYSLGGTQCGQCLTVYNVSSKQCLEDGCPTGTYLNDSENQCLVRPKLANIGAAENWIYGEFTPDEYSESVAQMRQSTFPTTCPQDEPYSTPEQQCIACEEQQVYDLFTKSCTQCQEGEVFDKESHECIKQVLNGGVIIPGDQGQETQQGEKQQENQEQEQENKENQEENEEEQENQQENEQQEQKEQGEQNADEDENKDQEQQQGKVSEGQQNNQNQKLCAENLYWSGTICIKCDSPGKYNAETLKCDCPENQTYNSEKQVCVFGNGIIAYVPNLQQSKNWIYGVEGMQGYDEQLAGINSQITTQECSLDAPYPDENGKCVTCGEGQLFDLTTKRCTTCIEGQQFNEQTHQCESISTNPHECEQNQFWNGTTCIKCQEPGEFTDDICVCPQNFEYSWESQECRKYEIRKITNFASEEWTYGQLTSQSYNEKVQKQSKGYKVQKCPFNLPFVSNSGDCINCPDNKIYDLSTGFCIQCANLNPQTHACELEQKEENVVCPDSLPFFNGTGCIKCDEPGSFNEEKKVCQCPQDYFFDLQNFECVIIPTNLQNSNVEAVNFVGQRPKINEKIETCDKENPYFNGNDCIECSSPNYFDFETQSCLICEEKFVFDISSKKCILEEVPVVVFNSLVGGDQNAKNYCCEVPAFNGMVQTCPQEKPFFNNKECIQCGYPYYFNFTILECQICEEGNKFSHISKVCVQEKFFSQVYKSSVSEEMKNYVGEPQKLDQLYENVKSCPEDNPYYDSDQCLRCALPSYFNFNSLKCESCPADKYFNLDNKKCQDKPLKTDKYNNYLVQVENFAGDVPNYDSQYATCQSTYPYYNGEECVSCQMPSFFNMQTLACEQCSQEEQFFNIVTRQCELSTQSYITNIKQQNIYYNGNFDKLVNFTNTKMKSDSSIQYCPDDKPFYQAITGECISCPEDNPFFDIKYGKCKSCEGDSYFDSTKHICISTGVIQPTVERMIMNIFTFI